MSKSFFKQVAAHFSAELPFVVYRKPNLLEVNAILQKDATLHSSEHFKESGFVFSPFDSDAQSILLPLNVSEHISIAHCELEHSGLKTGEERPTDEAAKAAHIELVTQAINTIKESELQKVVVSRKETVPLEEKDPLVIFQSLLEAYPSALVYCWYHPKVGLWLGATPETLLKIEGRQFSIMALAGTQEYKGTTTVTWQAKELQEQQFVTDFILENINTKVQQIKVSNVETVKAGNLLHLRTLIRGQLNLATLDFEALLKRLHPTPAVCGLPKAKAKAFVLKHEHYDRSFYTGFLGELNFETQAVPRTGRRNIEHRAYAVPKKSTQLYVNLRCMQIENEQAYVYVGGGITETSQPEREWEETVSKSKVVKKAI